MELLQRNLFLVTCIVLILDPHADGGGGPSKRSRKGESLCSVSCVNRTADGCVCACAYVYVCVRVWLHSKHLEKWIYISEFRDPNYNLYCFALCKYTCDLSVVDMVTELHNGRSGFQIPLKTWDFFLQNVHTGSGGPPSLLFNGYRGFSQI